MKGHKKKHHYIPQFYTSGFTNEKGEVHVLDHEKDKINKQGKNGTFHKKRLYTIDFDKAERRSPNDVQKVRESLGIDHIDISQIPEDPDMIENMLMDCENLAAPILRKLIAQEPISYAERIEFSTFIALMYTRNPSFLEFARQIEKSRSKEHLDRLLDSPKEVRSLYEEMKKSDEHKDLSEEKFLSILKESEIQIEIPAEVGLQGMLLATTIIDEIVYNKTWVIIEAPKGTSFISSDMPIFLDHPDVYEKGIFSVGFGTANAKAIFPLSKECLLIMEDGPRGAAIGYSKVGKDMVRKLNKRIFERSGNYVIARDRAHIENLKKGFGSFPT